MLQPEGRLQPHNTRKDNVYRMEPDITELERFELPTYRLEVHTLPALEVFAWGLLL